MENRQLFSIGEVAKSIHVTRRMILNYEQHGLIMPDIKEGTLGNRYYSVDSLTRIRSIRRFQDMGLSLKEIRSYLNDTTELDPLIKRLETLRDELNLNIDQLRARMSNVASLQIERAIYPAQLIYRKMRYTETHEEKKDYLRTVFREAIRLYGSDISRYMFFTESTFEEPKKVYYCVSIPEKSQGDCVYALPETHALCVVWRGDYDRLLSVRDEIISYAKQEAIQLTGVCRHIYLEGPPQHQDEDKFITQVVLPIAE